MIRRTYIYIYIYVYTYTVVVFKLQMYTQKCLVGGFKHFIFFHNIRDVMLPIDFHIFQDGYCTTNPVHMEAYEYVVHLNLMTRQ